MTANKNSTNFGKLILIAISAVLLMSLVPVLIRWINVNPATIGIVRLAIGALGMAIFAFVSNNKLAVNRKEVFWLALLGLIFALHWYTYFVSIKIASASLAAIGVATFGIHLLLLSGLINKQKLTIADIIAVLLSLAGVYLTSSNIDIEQTKLYGFLLAIVSGFLYACLPIINQRLSHTTTQTRALGQFGFGLIAFLFLLPQADFDLTANDWQGLLVLGIICTLVAHTLWIKASTELPSNLTAVIYYAYVPMSMLLSFIVLDESMSWQKITGAGLIISANVLVVLFHKINNNKNRIDGEQAVD